MRDKKTRDLFWIGLIWIILGGLGEFWTIYVVNSWYPRMASAQGEVTASAFAFLLFITVPGFLLISTIILYSAIRFRVSDKDTQDSPTQYRYRHGFAWTWLGLSVALNVLFIIYPGVAGLRALWNDASSSANNAMEIDVTASQWNWNFQYPQYKITIDNELVLPVNRPIKFVLRSSDVIHSFWVPAFGLKKDIIPGQTEVLYITPNKLTSTQIDPLARVQCAEICGVGHGEMRASLRVVSLSDFQQWVSQKTPGGMNMPTPTLTPSMNMPTPTLTPSMNMPTPTPTR